jgi:hypothetical protein
MGKAMTSFMAGLLLAACLEASTSLPAFEAMRVIEVPALDGIDIDDAGEALPRLDRGGIRDYRVLVNDRLEGPEKTPAAGVDPSDAHPRSATTTRGGTTVYALADELTLRVTDGQTTTEIQRNPGSKALHMADGTLWVAERNDNAWIRYSADGSVTQIPHLGEWVLFDAIGDSLLIGRKEDGKRRVRVIAR